MKSKREVFKDGILTITLSCGVIVVSEETPGEVKVKSTFDLDPDSQMGYFFLYQQYKLGGKK